MPKSLQIDTPLVSVNWLFQHKEATNLVVLNATLPKVTVKKSEPQIEEYQIPNARFFDLKKVFSVQGASFPNTVQSADEFENAAQELGIDKDACIIVYDEHGIYSSPRVWWLFQNFGFDNIAVLDGGFPAWKTANYSIEKKEEQEYSLGNFEVISKENNLIDTDTVLNALENNSKQIIDARSAGRFYGTAPEPRKEVRSGHIPNSKSLPYPEVVTNGALKSAGELKTLFSNVNPENKELIFSCGSGITACVLALGATIAGYEKLAVYDGSWTEWGSLKHLPIEK